MKDISLDLSGILNAVIVFPVLPANAGNRPDQASGFQVQRGMETGRLVLNNPFGLTPAVNKKVEIA